MLNLPNNNTSDNSEFAELQKVIFKADYNINLPLSIIVNDLITALKTANMEEKAIINALFFLIARIEC